MRPTLSLLVLVSALSLLACGGEEDIGSSIVASTTICTNGDCPPPDPGCTNGDCPPPDPGCTNGDCPPPTDPAMPVCCLDIDGAERLCCGLGETVISCRLSTLPAHNLIVEGFLEPTTSCRPKVTCEMEEHCVPHRAPWWTGRKHRKYHDVIKCFEVKKCRMEKECEPTYCTPDWWPLGATDVTWPAGADCGWWDSIQECKNKPCNGKHKGKDKDKGDHHK